MPDGLSGEEQAIYFSKVRGFFDSYACSRVMGRRKKMGDEYIRKADAVDMCGGYGDLAYMMSKIKPADVVQVCRCKDCIYHAYDEIFSCYWCEHPGMAGEVKPDFYCAYSEREE